MAVVDQDREAVRAVGVEVRGVGEAAPRKAHHALGRTRCRVAQRVAIDIARPDRGRRRSGVLVRRDRVGRRRHRRVVGPGDRHSQRAIGRIGDGA